MRGSPQEEQLHMRPLAGQSPVTQERRNHGVVMTASTWQLVVYGGTCHLSGEPKFRLKYDLIRWAIVYTCHMAASGTDPLPIG